MSNLPNLAFIGRMGSGKTTAAELCVEHLRYSRLSFAGLHPGGLRDVATRLWGDTEGQTRERLQGLGMFVRGVDPDTWVRNALAELTKDNRLPVVVHAGRHLIDAPVAIDDMRFPNEAWAVKGRGFKIVRVVAERNVRLARLQANGKLQSEDQLEHESETQLDNWNEDYTIYSEGTKLELFHQITDILQKESV